MCIVFIPFLSDPRRSGRVSSCSRGCFGWSSGSAVATAGCQRNVRRYSHAICVAECSSLRRERRANVTVVDVLTQRLENEQESCKRQSEAISSLRIELMAYQGTQVSALPCFSRLFFCCESCVQSGSSHICQPKVELLQARVLEFVKKCRSRILLMSGQLFFSVFKMMLDLIPCCSHALLERRRCTGAAQARVD